VTAKEAGDMTDPKPFTAEELDELESLRERGYAYIGRRKHRGIENTELLRLTTQARRSLALESRVAELEAELATLREAAGLEKRVREALGDRRTGLRLGLHSGGWSAAWNHRDGDFLHIARTESAPDLPSLLRAILEVEGG
jgi:hypothetical protein